MKHRILNSIINLTVVLTLIFVGRGIMPVQAKQVMPVQDHTQLPAGLSATDWVQIKAMLPAAIPSVQQAYLKASNPGKEDFFGQSVAISGDTVVVGAYQEASNGTGPIDNSMPGAGAAYVFVHVGTSWVQQAYLKASNPDAGDHFGVSVAISGDTVVVGAYTESSNGISQADNSMMYAGAAYVFVRDGTSWSQQAYLKASNPDAGDFFGLSVAISKDTVVIGAYGESSNSINQADNSMQSSGAAYVFIRNGLAWNQQFYLKASNPDGWDQFGISVDISLETVVIGANWESGNFTGGESNNSKYGAGAAYVFVRNGTEWSQQAYLKASNPDMYDSFGWSVAIDGDTVGVGAIYESSNGNSGELDNSIYRSGAAYIYVRDGMVWSQQAYLKAANPDKEDLFGNSLDIFGNTIAVGAFGEASNGTNQEDNSLISAGAVYVFIRSGTAWSQQTYIKASNPDSYDYFGLSIALFDDTIVTGAHQEDSDGSKQTDNSLSNTGAVYVFTPAPSINLGDKPATFTTIRMATFTFSSNDLTTNFQCKLDSGYYSNCISPQNLAKLNVGKHIFRTYAKLRD
jgi:drug/metabolite transporter superfamily protein YnfA